MSDKIPCSGCGKLILPDTAEKTGGFCMPCYKSQDTEAGDGFAEIANLLAGMGVNYEKDAYQEATRMMKLQKKFMAKVDRMLDESGIDDIEEFVEDFWERHNRLPMIDEVPEDFTSSPQGTKMVKEVLELCALRYMEIDNSEVERTHSGPISQTRYIEYIQVEQPVTNLETKFGGQPVWLNAPEWPTSRSTGLKMSFIGQVVLDEKHFGALAGKVVYLFMNTDEDADATWDPNAGENAVIVQPGNNTVPCVPDATGPVVGHAYDSMFDTQGICEFAAQLTDVEEYEDEEPSTEDKISGLPAWWQAEDYPYAQAIFIAQFTDGSIPLDINFGTGTAYVFVNQDGSEGKLLWQC